VKIENRYLQFFGSLFFGGLAILSFLASNSPDEVIQRADAWLGIPLIGQIPNKFVVFAGNRWTLATSFFIVGAFVGWQLAKRKKSTSKIEWWDMLASEMWGLAHRIDESKWHSNHEQLIADINVLGVKASKHGLAFPSNAAGFNTIQSFIPYLTQVSAFLKANELQHARSAAERLSKHSS
jgi:hypothetical protein